ncbi:phage portal protein%2C SPP1 family [Chlamydia trachomatis]|nr:phage portal protein%2C SPP1 family [Chlamydia trachomatis]
MSMGDLVHETESYDASKLHVTFTPNLPKSLAEMIANFKALGGMVSNETAMELTNIVSDVDKELERLNEPAPSDYDNQPKSDTKKAYAIQSILLKYHKKSVTRKTALKLFADIGIDEVEANDYLDDGIGGEDNGATV